MELRPQLRRVLRHAGLALRSVGDFRQHLRHALGLDVPSLIVLPIDYSVDFAISDELGEETVIRT